MPSCSRVSLLCSVRQRQSVFPIRLSGKPCPLRVGEEMFRVYPHRRSGPIVFTDSLCRSSCPGILGFPKVRPPPITDFPILLTTWSPDLNSSPRVASSNFVSSTLVPLVCEESSTAVSCSADEPFWRGPSGHLKVSTRQGRGRGFRQIRERT